MRTRDVPLTCLLVMAVSTTAQAQAPVISPHFVDFTASPDHSATKLDGTPVLTRYDMTAVAMTAQGALIWTQDLGKPAPNAANVCTVPFPAVLPITPEVLYTAKIVAIGPDGTSPPSVASNPFGLAGTRIPAGVVGSPRVR